MRAQDRNRSHIHEQHDKGHNDRGQKVDDRRQQYDKEDRHFDQRRKFYYRKEEDRGWSDFVFVVELDKEESEHGSFAISFGLAEQLARRLFVGE